jgi:crotonobetaine/carnitine-CoA ligase
VNTAEALGIGRNDVLYTTLPFFHTNALNTIVQALVHGARVVVGERFSASRFWETLVETDATVTYILGAMAAILANRDPSPLDRGHHVRVALSPATAPALWPVFSQRFGIRLIEGHGMTETNLAIGPLNGDQRPGWMGRVMTGFQARIVDEDDEEVPHGNPGELVLRADEPWAFANGYRGMAEETVASGATYGSTPATAQSAMERGGSVSSTGRRTRSAAAARTSPRGRSSRRSAPMQASPRWQRFRFPPTSERMT